MPPQLELRTPSAIAHRQHGLLTSPQLRALGWSDRTIRRAAHDGRLRRERPGVYALAGAVPSWEQAVLAVCLAGGPDAVASHWSALRLWGAAPTGHSGGIHVVTPPGVRLRLRGVVAHQSGLLGAADVGRRRRIPTTSPARTIVDCAGGLGAEGTARALTTLLRARLVRLEEVRACLVRLAGPGRRELTVVRSELARRLPGWDLSESELEIRALRAIHAAGLPMPVQQHRISLGNHRYYADLAYPELKIVIELDGWDAHGDRTAFDRDRSRARELTLAGWCVLSFTSADTGAALVHAIRRAIESASRVR
ncbi:MAG: type IV toxin-antitoxin system AbiEi family antitoxin domain-containing protein [Actinobacteria bacterium]|nr:type IV toxin-antitoxin system AbiEi family antitoxin domain-containing protein [Actinomycetota bacterium]